eukprot:c20767_g3_i3.p2 GENE.c20767_g3_i3~~c20767_g3_i3.p2  ORF type:complete len:243 (-),score=56.18 c20767_g3_i3:969-1697(-)
MFGLRSAVGRGRLFVRWCTATQNTATKSQLDNLIPRAIVNELNRDIVGQLDAKRAVAIALRNRWRRHRLPADMKNEVLPKNILMIGPTGVGKTEIVRRITKILNVPFIKVEATKFTEVGFHGRDVDQIIRDLLDSAISQIRQRIQAESKDQVKGAVNERILELLLGDKTSNSKADFLKILEAGELEDRFIVVPGKRASTDALINTPNVPGTEFDILKQFVSCAFLLFIFFGLDFFSFPFHFF